MFRIWKYVTYGELHEKIASYGYVYSLKRYVLSMVFFIGAFLLCGMLFALKLPCIFCLAMVGVLCLPAIVKGQYYNLYEQKRFRDVDIYLHQMIYSFQKQPKISIALSDAYKVLDGKMKATIETAREELKYGLSQWVYEDALEIIEKQYSSDRVSLVHRFMVSVEEKGGTYQSSIHVLLADLDRWVKRVYQSQEEIKKVKRDISIGIIISVLLGATTMIISWVLQSSSEMEMDMRINEEPLYQMISTIFLVGCVLFYTYTQVHYSSNWLTATRTDRQVAYDLKLIRQKEKAGMTRKKLLLILVGMVFMGIAMLFGQYIVGGLILLCGIIALNGKNIMRNSARKRIEEDIYTGFSEWLRNVALGLQEKTLQAAIEDSYQDCPYVMKDSLSTFIDQLEIDPSDVTPYYEFLKEFEVPDISTGVRTLYGLSELDHANIDETINGLISRNYELQDKHEMVKQSDRISLMKFSEYIPVFMVSVKMGLDMMLLITCYI